MTAPPPSRKVIVLSVIGALVAAIVATGVPPPPFATIRPAPDQKPPAPSLAAEPAAAPASPLGSAPRLSSLPPRFSSLPGRAPAPPSVPPTAELRGVRAGKTRIGGHFWLLRYVNTGTTPIVRPAARASFQDAQGRSIGEQVGYAQRSYLAPGEETPLLILASKPPRYARAEVTLVPPQAPRYESPLVTLKVRQSAVGRAALGPAVIGTVTNPTSQAVRFAQVQVVGLDKKGELALLGNAYASPFDLAPGKESTFQVPIGTFSIGKVARYTVSAFGRGGP